MMGGAPVSSFEDWYGEYTLDREGCLDVRNIGPKGQTLWREFDQYKREMDIRVAQYGTLEKLADGEVIHPKPDLPNVSSGETAGMVRRIARNLVQNTPNVEVLSKFDDDSVPGIFSRHILTSKIIGSDQYSNDMQQNLFASTKTALTLGFSCVIPVLLQDAAGSWFMKYDSIHYRDVFPEPGCKDVRDATSVFIRRYLTKGEVVALIRDNAPGWDVNALKTLLQSPPRARDWQSVDHQTKKRNQIPDGYEIITWYSSGGENFLTFSANTRLLLRIEKNKHPLKLHPVHFLVLEKDDQQPLGKSQVELLIGRQDFQDLMLNGAMKLWYRNINPSIIGYGAVNSIPNLSPGKYTQISNPNAKIEPFEVNTQTLMQYGSISQQNLGSMVSMIGAADQQMATQAGNGMSATPQGVEAQQAMVDITTNNYQKAIESFFSHYCSYALTMFFQELKAVKKVAPTAEARGKLLEAGLDPAAIDEDGVLEIDFEKLAVEYWVRTVPGSLVEMEDEKQLRILNQLFIPLSQAMPALANTQDTEALKQASKAMQYIIGKQIELSGSASAQAIGLLWDGKGDEVDARDARILELEGTLNTLTLQQEAEYEQQAQHLVQLQSQVSQLTEMQMLLLEKLGVTTEPSEEVTASSASSAPEGTNGTSSLIPVNA
jgi:hypothetical protein